MVTGAISTVILPGLGAVCPECFCRGFLRLSRGLPIDGREIYTFSMTGPESELSWDIARAQELLTQRPHTVEGKVTEIPQIAAGPGITPEDAGLRPFVRRTPKTAAQQPI